MKVWQQNLNHCRGAQDLLTQAVTEARPDLLLISEPYQKPDNPLWVSDATGKAAIWSCNDLQFQEFDSTNEGFVRVKLGNIHFLSCYVPPK